MDDLSFESTRSVRPDEFRTWVARRGGWDPSRYELLDGRIVKTPPAGYPHGSVEARLVAALHAHVAQHALGEVLGSSQGYELPSGDVVAPDASFVESARWAAAAKPESGGYLRVVPDLAVEILSPSTASRDRGEKRALFARAGVREYWLVDPRARTVAILVLRDGAYADERVHRELESLESVVLPRLVLRVSALLP